MKAVIFVVAISLVGMAPARAQALVDPTKVAPEFREAAEKRRAEQLKQIACNKAAHDQKIAPREVLKFVTDCFDGPDTKPAGLSVTVTHETAPTPK